MKEMIKLCRKERTGKNGNKFYQYFCYRQQLDPATSQYLTVLVPATDKDGNAIMVAKSIHVAFDPELQKEIAELKEFPYLIEIEQDEATGIRDYFIGNDKNRDGTPKLDKEGRKHPLLYLFSYRSLTPAPKVNMTFEDAEMM